MYGQFSLILIVNHACNLRCDYCYTGAKFHRPMSAELGRLAIDRALASLQPGGTLDLGFFGGEPLLEADRVHDWIEYARIQASSLGITLRCGLTTNGTIQDSLAWEICLRPDVNLAVSCDGDRITHDLHRRFPNRSGSARLVHQTLRRLVAQGKDLEVVTVVRPTTVELLPDNLTFLQAVGIRRLALALDVWASWSAKNIASLIRAIERCAQLWNEWLPHVDINWFSDKLAGLAAMPCRAHMRSCGFGDGEVAVAPSGYLYPCERLVGEDAAANPWKLPGRIEIGSNFLNLVSRPTRSIPACRQCPIHSICQIPCPCSNCIRTGEPGKPDGLLCLVEKTCARAIEGMVTRRSFSGNTSKQQPARLTMI